MLNATRVESDSFYGQHRKCLSWSAVIAGAIVACVISFLLNLFGVGIGLSAFTNTPQGVQAFAIGGFIGLIIITIASTFVGGMVSGYLGRTHCFRRNFGMLYGILAYGVALFFSMSLTVPMTKFIADYSEGLYGNTSISAAIANPKSASSTVISNQDVTTNAPAMNDTNSATAAATEKNANDLGKTGLFIFALFAIGAFSACLGGHFGMLCKCDDECLSEKPISR